MKVRSVILLLSLMLGIGQATGAEVWFKNPSKAPRSGQAALSDRSRREPMKPHYQAVALRAPDVLAVGQQIDGVIFGAGRPKKESTRVLEVLSKLSITVEGKTIEVPRIGLRDLARLKLPNSLTIFRAGKFIIVEIDGPDGSDGYEVQFVCDGTRFLYRLVRYQQGPLLARYPNPLRLEF